MRLLPFDQRTCWLDRLITHGRAAPGAPAYAWTLRSTESGRLQCSQVWPSTAACDIDLAPLLATGATSGATRSDSRLRRRHTDV